MNLVSFIGCKVYKVPVVEMFSKFISLNFRNLGLQLKR